MQKVVHTADSRGKGEHGWLSTRYSFSFADWYDPTRMGFGALRVINDDRIAPANGFGAHRHQDMEIITIVTKGTVTHEDSIGNTGTVSVGEVQVMSAGTGVTHAERNDSPDEELTLFQIWIATREKGVEPRYAQKSFGEMIAGTRLLVAPDTREGALAIQQDAFISEVVLEKDSTASYVLKDTSQGVYAFVIDGSIAVMDEELGSRDAIGIVGEQEITFSSSTGAKILVMEVPV